mgnify:CR=1 FL=1
MNKVYIHTEFIKLQQVLKLAGLIDQGSDVKYFLSQAALQDFNLKGGTGKPDLVNVKIRKDPIPIRFPLRPWNNAPFFIQAHCVWVYSNHSGDLRSFVCVHSKPPPILL